MELFHRDFGQQGRPPLVLLHGLLGSSRNWMQVGKRLAEQYDVYALDLRNHGQSPHHDTMHYAALAADVRAWLDRQGLDQVHLVGHSMGGKTAMRLACESPERVRTLTVADISPVAAPPRWQHEFAAMRKLDLASLNTRGDAALKLENDVPDWAFRQFLLTNLDRDPQSKDFYWTINLPVLEESLPDLFQAGLKDSQRFDGPTLFLKGENSRFIQDKHRPAIATHFPQARVEVIPQAGHNVHFDNVDVFIEQLEAFAQ
ncbi:MAG: alpha/beta hydrolase fold protein [Puniceicoccaceae bacterium 5H]|nr:MAG: alpha/beta hydrolase fold protein [Puniceicoccaceae bacterium 5H]